MELTIDLPADDQRLGVTGPAERNLKIIREGLRVNITARNGSLKVSGDDRAVAQAAYVVERLAQAAKGQTPMTRQELLDTLATVGRRPAGELGFGAVASPGRKGQQSLDVYLRGREVSAMTDGQRRYLEAIEGHDMTFCCGPAGTGKTFLAIGAAVNLLKAGRIRKLVLVRPAVEAGEKLGFLPGTMQDKVDPYVRPLLDALNDMMAYEQLQRFMACDLVEIIPLAFMRGRTLNDAVIILDEAQNTTKSQMLMFLTRLGNGSKMIINGDTSQIDLEDPRQSGLVDAARRLRQVKGIAMVTLGETDIVRHSLVQRVIDAYGRDRNPPDEAGGSSPDVGDAPSDRGRPN